MGRIIKLVFIFFLLIAVFLIALFFYWYFSIKGKYFGDLDKLYFSFSNYMKEEVSSRLRLINCQPKRYYYKDSTTFCFVCENLHPCFSFTWVLKGNEGGMKMNPRGVPYFAKYKDFDLKVVSFCKGDWVLKFDCKKEGKNKLVCENIEFVNENKNKIFDCNKIKMVLKGKFEDFVNTFCKSQNKEPKYVKNELENYVACGKYEISLGEEGMIAIGQIVEPILEEIYHGK
jgi:hypothetical protein